MVEDAERATDIIHFGSGTTVRQPANTDNWFHRSADSDHHRHFQGAGAGFEG
jgi:hypothetical protein